MCLYLAPPIFLDYTQSHLQHSMAVLALFVQLSAPTYYRLAMCVCVCVCVPALCRESRVTSMRGRGQAVLNMLVVYVHSWTLACLHVFLPCAEKAVSRPCVGEARPCSACSWSMCIHGLLHACMCACPVQRKPCHVHVWERPGRAQHARGGPSRAHAVRAHQQHQQQQRQ